MKKKTKMYNIYENPYASPLPEYDKSICSDCEGGTGEVGSATWKTQCENCREANTIFTAIMDDSTDWRGFFNDPW
jgi:hypothetical protein